MTKFCVNELRRYTVRLRSRQRVPGFGTEDVYTRLVEWLWLGIGLFPQAMIFLRGLLVCNGRHVNCAAKSIDVIQNSGSESTM